MQRKRTLQRGGAHNRADRQSWHLTEQQCRQLIDAVNRAEAAGLPFNRYITILWERAGTHSTLNARITGAFIKRAADWLRPYGYRLAWAWVQENSVRNGAHVHMLLHVPPELDPLFRVMPLRWVKLALPGSYKRGTIETQRIAGANALPVSTVFYRANRDRKVGYMLKGCTATVGASLGLSRRGEASFITGKRLGVWQRSGPPPAGRGQVA